MNEYKTTRWNNVKARAQYLMEHGTLYGEGVELGIALCEEIDRLEERIIKLEELQIEIKELREEGK